MENVQRLECCVARFHRNKSRLCSCWCELERVDSRFVFNSFVVAVNYSLAYDFVGPGLQSIAIHISHIWRSTLKILPKQNYLSTCESFLLSARCIRTPCPCSASSLVRIDFRHLWTDSVCTPLYAIKHAERMYHIECSFRVAFTFRAERPNHRNNSTNGNNDRSAGLQQQQRNRERATEEWRRKKSDERIMKNSFRR